MDKSSGGNGIKKKISRDNRPQFPEKAVVTGGMPYGNKKLHFGHVGGVFVFADVFARFLRDRIGRENVIFVSGTDCYGSPIAESYRKLSEEQGYKGTIKDFVSDNHESQKKTLEDYGISLDLFGASGLGRTADVHNEVSDQFIRKLYENGQLQKISTAQFYDEKVGTFLNGRQVVGKCPVQGCQSEKGYADECDLGHQYMPQDLIDPKSTLTGEKPVMKNVDNWYFKLTDHYDILREYAEDIRNREDVRQVVFKTISEFLEPPVIYIMNDFRDKYEELKDRLENHELIEEPKKTSFTIKFSTLPDREKSCAVLSEAAREKPLFLSVSREISNGEYPLRYLKTKNLSPYGYGLNLSGLLFRSPKHILNQMDTTARNGGTSGARTRLRSTSLSVRIIFTSTALRKWQCLWHCRAETVFWYTRKTENCSSPFLWLIIIYCFWIKRLQAAVR